MAAIAIIGDGPGGLSAALFIARAGHEVTVYGSDETVMHYAFLNNYLGIPAISGTDFQVSARQQVLNAGATLSNERVTEVVVTGDQIEVTTEAGTNSADFVVLGEGKQMPLADALGIQTSDGDDANPPPLPPKWEILNYKASFSTKIKFWEVPRVADRSVSSS